MSEQKSYRTLLPDNRTPYEQAYEQAIADLMSNEDFYSWLTDPQKTRADLLDIMAKEAGVADWFASDSESDKRDSIEKSIFIHQKSGTRQGIIEALEALGCTAQIKRGEKPYSLEVFNLITDKPLTEDLQKRLNSRVSSVKSERDSINLELGRFWLGNVQKVAIFQKQRTISFKDF